MNIIIAAIILGFCIIFGAARIGVAIETHAQAEMDAISGLSNWETRQERVDRKYDENLEKQRARSAQKNVKI